MSNILGTLFVELKASTAEFVTGMSTASRAAKDAGKDIQSSFSALSSVASTALAPFGAVGSQISQAVYLAGSAARSATSEFSKLGGSMNYLAVGAGSAVGVFTALGVGALTVAARTADANARLYEQAQRAGISVEALSHLSYAAKQVGVDQDSLVRSLDFMAKAAFTSTTGNNLQAKAFKDLGISVLGANGAFKPADQLFAEIAGKLSTMTDQTKRSALEMTLFGRGGAQLAPLINLGTAAIENYGKALDKMGGTVTAQAGKAAQQYKENLRTLGQEFDALGQKLTSELLPAMIKFTAALAGPNKPGVIENLFDFYSRFKNTGTLGGSTPPGLQPPGLPSAYKPPYTAGATTEDQLAGDKKRKESIQALIDKEKEEIAVFKLSDADLLVYKLNALGASDAMQSLGYALARHLEAMKADDAFQQRVAQRQADAVKRYQDETEEIQRQAGALDALMNEAQAAQSGSLVGQQGGQLATLKNDAYDAANAFKALSDSMKETIANHGKSDIELQIEAYEKLPGATSEGVAALKQMQAQVNALDDTTAKASGVWKNFGDTISRDLTESTQKGDIFRKLMRDLLRDLQQSAIKGTLFGQSEGRSGGGGIFGGLGKVFGGNSQSAKTPPFLAAGTTTGVGSPTGGFLSTIGRLFGLGGGSSSAAVVRDGNTTGRSVYVTPVDLGGTVIDAQDQASAVGNAIGDPNAAIPTLSSTLKSLINLPVAAHSGGDVGIASTIGKSAIGLLGLIPGLAGGGPTDAGSAYVVGEQGPELFVPSTPGNIVSGKAINSSGGTTYNIDARGAVDPAATAMAVQRAIQQSENRAVARSTAAQKQLALRTPASATS